MLKKILIGIGAVVVCAIVAGVAASAYVVYFFRQMPH